jgi:hypothetical protein
MNAEKNREVCTVKMLILSCHLSGDGRI